MNPLLTANFRADRELHQDIEKQNLNEVGESLKSALPWLEQAYRLMNANRLDAKYSSLYVAICDAMTAVQEASSSLDDSPDDTSSAIVPYQWEEILEVVNIDSFDL